MNLIILSVARIKWQKLSYFCSMDLMV